MNWSNLGYADINLNIACMHRPALALSMCILRSLVRSSRDNSKKSSYFLRLSLSFLNSFSVFFISSFFFFRRALLCFKVISLVLAFVWAPVNSAFKSMACCCNVAELPSSLKSRNINVKTDQCKSYLNGEAVVAVYKSSIGRVQDSITFTYSWQLALNIYSWINWNRSILIINSNPNLMDGTVSYLDNLHLSLVICTWTKNEH